MQNNPSTRTPETSTSRRTWLHGNKNTPDNSGNTHHLPWSHARTPEFAEAKPAPSNTTIDQDHSTRHGFTQSSPKAPRNRKSLRGPRSTRSTVGSASPSQKTRGDSRQNPGAKKSRQSTPRHHGSSRRTPTTILLPRPRQEPSPPWIFGVLRTHPPPYAQSPSSSYSSLSPLSEPLLLPPAGPPPPPPPPPKGLIAMAASRSPSPCPGAPLPPLATLESAFLKRPPLLLSRFRDDDECREGPCFFQDRVFTHEQRIEVDSRAEETWGEERRGGKGEGERGRGRGE